MCSEHISDRNSVKSFEERVGDGFLDALDPVIAELERRYEGVLAAFFESVARARHFSDVNLAAGVAQMELLGIREPA